MGLSRALLEFGGGSGEFYAKFSATSLSPRCWSRARKAATSVGISALPSDAEGPLVASRAQAATQRTIHRAAAPAFDVALHVTRATLQTFDRIGGRERLTEVLRNPEAEHGEHLIEHPHERFRGCSDIDPPVGSF